MKNHFTRSFYSYGLIALALTASSLDASTVLRVEPENQQPITHWGLATMNRPDWGKQWDIGEYPNSMNALYRELGANLVRIHIDYRVGNEGSRQRNDLKKAILNATNHGMQWYGLPWSPPVEMKTIKQPNGEVKGELNYLKEGYEDEVAKWLTDLVVWLQNEGVPLPVGIGPQNESDFGPPGYPGCIYTADQMQKTVIELRKALDLAGLNQVLVIADDGAKPVDDMWPGNIQYLNSGTVNMMGLQPGGAFATNASYRDAVGVVATHTYDLHNNLFKARPDFLAEFSSATRGIGKPVWMTEWEPTDKHVNNDWEIITETVRHFNRDISSLGFNAWLHWHLWNGHALSDGTLDSGECLSRIRPGDVLIYKNVEFGDNPDSIKLRYSTNNSALKVSIHLGDATGPVIATGKLPPTTEQSKVFETAELPVRGVSGAQTIAICFEAEQFWKEADLNWFEVSGARRVEAESVTEKFTKEPWSAAVASCYSMGNRLHAVYDDGVKVQRRPLFYIFKKIWNSAPAGRSYVRRVTSDSPAFRGESKVAIVENARQDLSAFITASNMTLTILNHNDSEETVRLEGLSGTSAELFRYLKSDATSIDQEMTSITKVSIVNGAVDSLTLPGDSLNVLITNGGAVLPPIVWNAINQGPRVDQDSAYNKGEGSTSIDPSEETRRKKALEKYGKPKAAEETKAQVAPKPVAKVMPRVTLGKGSVDATAMELDNRLMLIDVVGGGEAVAVKAGAVIGNAKIVVSNEGVTNVAFSLIDGPGDNYIKLYHNKVEQAVWDMNVNDERVVVKRVQLKLTPGDEISVKIFGSEKLLRIE